MPRARLNFFLGLGLFFLLIIIAESGNAKNIIVADSLTHLPLPRASIYDRHGKAIGISDKRGKIPPVAPDAYPLTIRYIGFQEKQVRHPDKDTVFLQEYASELPEVIIEAPGRKILHILAYVRESSALTTYSDTIRLFREKLVDYMLPLNKKVKFKGWTIPRTLTSNSYYRFTDKTGLDSVSDECNYHFSWSDWIGIPPKTIIPSGIRNKVFGSDTVKGKYSPTEIWIKDNDKINVEINVLADTLSRKWVPNLSDFFHGNLDFEQLRINFDYDNVLYDSITPENLEHYSFFIDSNGRGHNMFRFNKKNEPFFVSTSAEVYILDREYISNKEAAQWLKFNPETRDLDIFEPIALPDLPASVQTLIERVSTIDKSKVKLTLAPDRKLISPNHGRKNFKVGQRALNLLKDLTGITLIKSHRNRKKRWNEFRREQLLRNRSHE